jgi:tryptophanyl-tRNA synthetase
MSKSLNNHIEIAASPEETRQRVMMMVTDPQRIKRTDPGNPDICNVFSMHKIFTPQADVEMINVECRRAGIGCVDCKKIFAGNLNKALEPFRAKRAELAAQPDLVPAVLEDGAKRARAIAEKTMAEVRAAVQLP